MVAPTTMKAVIQKRYGDPGEVLELREVDRPSVGDDEVLVRVKAASVHPDVWHVVAGQPYVLRLMGAGVTRPRDPIPGTDMAGTIETIGGGVTRFAAGDAVFGETFLGLQWRNGGAFAEYVSVPQEALAKKPEHVSFEEAASIPSSGFIAVHNLDFGKRVEPGAKVLVNGAAGNVGSIALQIAKSRGAIVTGVDAGDKLDLVRELGADHVIDYTQVDPTSTGERFDLIFDVASTLSLSQCKRALTENGTYVLIGHDHYGGSILGSVPRMFKLMALTPFSRHLAKMIPTPKKGDVVAMLRELLESGQLTPMIDKVFALADVGEAMRYMQSGEARGRILVSP